MSFHLLAYRSTTLEAATSPLTMPGIVDPVITRSATSSLYILQQRMKVLAGVGMSVGMQRIQLSSPTLRQVNIPYFRPVIQAVKPASGSQVCWLGDVDFWLPKLEELGPIATSNAGAAEAGIFLLWVADNVMPIPTGPVLTARATATITQVAGAWTLGSMTLEQSLPQGDYALVGSECISATGVAHRFAFFNQVLRPGNLSHNSLADIQDYRLAQRRLGLYGTFNNTTIPQLEVLSSSADAAQEVYLQLVPISGQMVA